MNTVFRYLAIVLLSSAAFNVTATEQEVLCDNDSICIVAESRHNYTVNVTFKTTDEELSMVAEGANAKELIESGFTQFMTLSTTRPEFAAKNDTAELTIEAYATDLQTGNITIVEPVKVTLNKNSENEKAEEKLQQYALDLCAAFNFDMSEVEEALAFFTQPEPLDIQKEIDATAQEFEINL